MKKIISHLFIILGLLQSNAQNTPDSLFQGEWINPVNNVPFITQVGVFNQMDSNILGDTVIWIFNGDLVYSYDTVPFLQYYLNPITVQNYAAVFGPTAQITGNMDIELFTDLLDLSPINTQLILDQSEWEPSSWDTTLFPWITNRTILSTSLSMGVQVAWDWGLHDTEALQTILSPTVPVIQGEDMDYAILTDNFALDHLDSVNTQEKIEIANEFGIYVYSVEEFQEVYDAFILSLFETEDFYPLEFDFNIFHQWLGDYLTAESILRLQLLSLNELSPSTFQIIKEDDLSYSFNYQYPVYGYDIFDAQGKLLGSFKTESDQILKIPPSVSHILFIRFQTEKGIIVKKIHN